MATPKKRSTRTGGAKSTPSRASGTRSTRSAGPPKASSRAPEAQPDQGPPPKSAASRPTAKANPKAATTRSTTTPATARRAPSSAAAARPPTSRPAAAAPAIPAATVLEAPAPVAEAPARIAEAPAAAPARRIARPVADRPAALPSPQRAAIDAAFVDRRDLRQGLTDNLRTLRPDTEAVTSRVTAAFKAWNPSGMSADEAIARNFVADDADLADTEARIRDRRLTALTADPQGSGMTVQTNSGAGALVKGGKGTVKLGPLHEHITGRLDDLVVLPPTPATAVSVAAATADEVIAGIDGQPAADKDKQDGGNGAGGPKAVDAFVDVLVRRQVDSATAPETRPRFDVIPTGERTDATQAQILETFSLRPGPSDVTSVHDFNVLRIAFEHVWTRIFDDDVESLGRELYREYVGLKDFVGYDAPDFPITTIDDLRRLMGEIKDLSQIAQADVPPAIGGGTQGTTQPPKSGDDLENDLRGAGAVATGGLSLLVEYAIREIGKAGQKPVLTWDDVDGGVLNRGDRIKATVVDNVAAPGTVELVLLTDGNSHKKEFSFQTYVQETGQFVNVVFVTNYTNGAQFVDGGQHLRGTGTIQTSVIPIGMIEFASEETATIALGRYVLGGLGDRLKDRSRVTFYWTDN
jgi:hypothetical protein